MNDVNRYAMRVQRVVEYLAGHLDETLDLETLARVACFSPYHFHRIYRASLGETVNDTVRRLRLNRAAIDLLDADLSIERTARRAGYASQAAFTRAFRAEYGEPPGRYREPRGTQSLDHERSNTMYRVEMLSLPRLRVAAIQQRGDYQLASNAFERLMTIAATTGLLRPGTRAFGIFHDDPAAVPEAELRSTVCISVADDWIPSGEIVEAHIEGERYARIVSTGPYTELRRAYDWLYQTWLPGSAEEPRNLPCVEEYLNNPRQVAAKDLETAVMMPLGAEVAAADGDAA
jgi:AraC family transcriptional regulator